MKITVGHRLKSAHIARLAVHSTQRSVLLARQEMCMRLRQSNYHHVYKNAESWKWLQALVSETQLWDRVTAQKWLTCPEQSDQKKNRTRRSYELAPSTASWVLSKFNGDLPDFSSLFPLPPLQVDTHFCKGVNVICSIMGLIRKNSLPTTPSYSVGPHCPTLWKI